MATMVANIRMRQVIRAMAGANACSPETARDMKALGLRPKLTHKQAIYYLSGRGALVETAPGVYYMDTEATAQFGRLQRKILAIGMAGMGLLLSAFFILGL